MNTAFRALTASVLVFAPVFWLSSSVTANSVNAIDGTTGDDFIIVGASDARVTPTAGDDFLVGGPGNNRYVISAGDGEDTLYEVEGSNYVEFDNSIAYGDVSSGLMKSGNDLILNIGQNGQSLTVKNFFSVAGTISEFQFSSGESISGSLIFQVFGLNEPTATETSKMPYLGEEGVPLLTGSVAGDILVPIEDTDTLQGQEGDDFLVGRANGVTFEIGLGDGEDFIIAYEGQNVVLFVDGIAFNDVASNLMKSGDDLILSNGDEGNEVRIYRFFTRANTVSAIRFESGGEISADQVIDLFGLPAPAQAPPFQMIVDGTPLGGGDPGDGGGDGDLPLCSEPGADPDNCDDGSGENPPDGECDPAEEDCDGSGGDNGGGDNSGPGAEWPDLPRLTGTEVDDLLVAGASSSIITGGAGNDFIIGGPGDDHYWFESGDGVDVIRDVEGNNIVGFAAGITYADVAGGLLKASGDLVLNIGQSGQSLTVKDFFNLADTVQRFEFPDGRQLSRTQLFQAFGLTAPTATGQSLQLTAGRADGSPLVGSSNADILIPRMSTRILQGLDGDDYLVGRLGRSRGSDSIASDQAIEGVRFEIEPESGKKFVIAHEGRNVLLYTGSSARAELTFSRVADDLVLGSNQNDSQVRIYRFFSIDNTIEAIEFSDGTNDIHADDIFGMFEASRPSAHLDINMVVAGASFDNCSYNPWLESAEGYGLTDTQLSEPNLSPVIVTTPNLDAWASRTYDYLVGASDQNNDELCFNLSQAPEGMEVDQSSGLIWWQPTRSQFGVHPVEITVADERGAYVTQSFDVEVQDPNQPPEFISTALKTAIADQLYQYEVQVSDSDNAPLSIEIVNGSPGMAIVEGVLTWTPSNDQVGDHEVAIRAADAFGASSVQSFQITVLPFVDTADLPEGISRLPMTGIRLSIHPLDDAATQAGLPRIYVRDDALEIVEDRVNGLVWEDSAHVEREYDRDHYADQYCSGLEIGGIDNWRIPSRLELVFLLNHHRFDDDGSLIDPVFQYTGEEFFADDFNSYSRITLYDSTVNFENGKLLPESTTGANVRCVSGEKKFESVFFKPFGQDITVDRVNRLMWQDDAQILTNNASWVEALESCEAMELAGHSDWRLPNFNESQTLMREFDHHVTEDAPSDVFLNVPETRFWSASTATHYSGRAHTKDLYNQYWQFKYQSEVASGWIGAHIHQNMELQREPSPFRCIRSYAEPEPQLEPIPASIEFGETVTLDATDSFDADGTITAYQWVSLSDGVELGVAPTLQLDSLAPGNHEIQLTVTDNNGLSRVYPEPIVITVNPPPQIIIDGKLSVGFGQNVVLDASGSIGFSEIVSYKWVDMATGEVVGTAETLILSGLGVGTGSYSIEVTDVTGREMSSIFEVTVTEIPPEAVLEESYVIAEGASITLDGSESTDADGQVVAYRWFDGVSGAMLAESETLELNDLGIGARPYRLEVEDDSGLTDQALVTVNVGYRPEAVAPQLVSTYPNVPVYIDGRDSTVTEGTLTYQWYSGGELISENARIPVEYPDIGTYTVELTVSTSLGITDSTTVAIEVLQSPYEGAARELSQCPVRPVADDHGYEKLYPENNVEWIGGDASTVEDIQRAFNYARLKDPSVFQYLLMPSQDVWDSMGFEEKGLYLVNSERAARGIKPFEGVANQVVAVAKTYMDYLLSHNLVISHYADGLTPSERLNTNAYIKEYRHGAVSESLAAGIGNSEMPDVDQALVYSIFGWLYQDKDWFKDFDDATGPPWGHRDNVLQTGLNEDSGSPTSEGLVGFGISRGTYDPGQNLPATYGYTIAFQTVDQGDQWDLSNITTVDVTGAQGCNTAHILDIDDSLVETNGLSEIRLSPSTLMMVGGDSASLQVKAIYDNGNEIDITSYASFIADSRSVVSVNDGSITAKRLGQAQVMARINGVESNRLFVRVRGATDTSNLLGTSAESYSEYVPDNATVDEYDPRAMAVYTGLVVDRDGQPMPGVQASFLNQPELGSTKTDNDGRFTIAGPAGRQTILYERSEHLVVQRTTIGASNAWASLDDVMLLPRDKKQSRIDLTSGEPQVHQSTPITDESGTRKATVVFNGITSATVVSADGSTRELDEFQFSATEFETPSSMPGELPPETAFTFANDLHVAGVYYSDSVIFDSDVVMFVDNFLGFKVGEIVPIGYYDRLGNEWVASSNGIVVQLLDSDGDGVVDGLDYTGDSAPDDLDGDGSTSDEVVGLDGYEAGDTLWWGSFNHFSERDYNWASSEDEAPPSPDPDQGQEDENNEELECTGSYVKPYQQSFHEDISIAGTNLMLHYSSQRTEGYQHKARIKVSGDTIPSTLEQMIVKLEVAGRVFQRKLAPATNTEVEFTWDGARIDGVRPEGMVSGRISIGYEYKTRYISAGNAAEEGRDLSEFPVAWATVGDNVTEVPGRQNYISWQTRGVVFKNSFDRQLANGWSLSNVHEFDPAGQVYLGSGGAMGVETQSKVLKTGLTYSLMDGDDGYYQSGGSSIGYTISDEGVLVDQVTGLEWQFTDQPFETPIKAEAREYCANQAMPLNSGWRLPTPKEVAYTIEKSGASIGPAIYSLTQANYLWSKFSINPKGLDRPVICVRGESIDKRYVYGLQRDAAQQVVVDNDNGLMWQDSPENAATKLDWEASIRHCEASSHAGFDDWRLPNINELLYVLPNNVFEHQSRLSIPPGEYWNHDAPFRQPYWSSTTNYKEDTQAWAIESVSFNSERFSKTDQYHVRCVRDAASATRMPYRFDNDGKHVSTIDLDSGKAVVEYEYNDSDQLVGMTDQFGNHITVERDTNGKPVRIIAADGQVTELSINNQNNLKALTYEDGSNYQFSYEAGGLLTEKVDPNGNAYPHYFDEFGRVYQTQDPEGGQWNFFDERLGIGHNRYGYTTAEGNQYQTVRRILGNGDVRKEITYKNGATLVDTLRADQLQRTTSFGGVTTVTDMVRDSKTLQEIPGAISVTQPSGLTHVTSLNKAYGQNGADTTRYTITTDVNGNISTTDVDARAGTLVHTSAEGRVVSEIIDPDTLLTERLSVAGRLDTILEHDQRGRLVEETTGDRTVTYSYGSEGRGQVTAITATDGRKTLYEYDLLGRVTKVTHPDGRETVSSYDHNGNRTTLLVPTPANHDTSFNGINRPTSETTPLGEVTQYEYDRDRRLTAIELPSGDRLEHTYAQNRLTRTDTPEGTIEYDYHHGDQLSQITEGSETLSYTWDGSLLKETGYQGELNESIQYGHNTNFQVNQITYAGDSTSLTYDRDGLLTGIHGFTIGRHADHGLPVSLADGTLNRTFAYNGHGEVIAVSTALNQVAAFDYELTYNTVGQIVGKTETLPDGTVNQYGYTYDDRYRLIEVTKNSQLVEQYQYDANGNRTLATSTERGVSGVAASYNLGDQLQSLGNTTYTYDGNGRLSRKTTGTDVTTYDYDSLGRLKQVQTPNHTIEYRHNALGNRVAKVKDGVVVERYLWQDKTTLLAVYDGDGNLKQRFEYTLGHAPTSFTENGSTYYLLTDHLGSPRVVTDSAGQVVKAVEYDAYGNVISDSNPTLNLPFGFAGGLKDSDTGLIRFGFRDYDPQTGRWTARDPIGFAGGDANLYGYVLSNPLTFFDPLGLEANSASWQYQIDRDVHPIVNIPKMAVQYVEQAWLPSRESALIVSDVYAVGSLVPICTLVCGTISVSAAGYASILELNGGDGYQATLNLFPAIASYATAFIFKKADVVSEFSENAWGVGVGFYTNYWIGRDNHNNWMDSGSECRK